MVAEVFDCLDHRRGWLCWQTTMDVRDGEVPGKLLVCQRALSPNYAKVKFGTVITHPEVTYVRAFRWWQKSGFGIEFMIFEGFLSPYRLY